MGTLNEDMQLHVLSFISDAPFSTNDKTYTNNINSNQLDDLCESPLTHVLPIVSQHFRTLLRSQQADYLWKESLVRRIKTESFIWKSGILYMIAEWDSSADMSSLNDVNDADLLLNAASKSYKKFLGIDINSTAVNNIYQMLFRSIVSGYLRFEGPVFIMPGNAQLNHLIGLH